MAGARGQVGGAGSFRAEGRGVHHGVGIPPAVGGHCGGGGGLGLAGGGAGGADGVVVAGGGRLDGPGGRASDGYGLY